MQIYLPVNPLSPPPTFLFLTLLKGDSFEFGAYFSLFLIAVFLHEYICN